MKLLDPKHPVRASWIAEQSSEVPPSVELETARPWLQPCPFGKRTWSLGGGSDRLAVYSALEIEDDR